MINVQPNNEKLVDRAQRILMTLLGCERERAAMLLEQSGMNVRTALVMGRLDAGRQEAESLLAAAGGNIRQVLTR